MAIQVEEGRCYRSASGVRVGPMSISREHSYGGYYVYTGFGLCIMFPYGHRTSNPQLYKVDGNVYSPHKGEEMDHLVALWDEGPINYDDVV